MNESVSTRLKGGLEDVLLLTGPVGVDMLPQFIHRAETHYRSPSEPERRHRTEAIMKPDQELVQASLAYDVLQVTIPKKQRKHSTDCVFVLKERKSSKTGTGLCLSLLLFSRVQARNTRSSS